MRLMNVAAAFCVPWSCIRTNQKIFFVKHISLTFGVGRLIPDNLGSTPRDSWLISYSRDSAWLYSNICSVLMLTGEDLIDSVINLGNVWEECLFWCVIWIIDIVSPFHMIYFQVLCSPYTRIRIMSPFRDTKICKFRWTWYTMAGWPSSLNFHWGVRNFERTLWNPRASSSSSLLSRTSF